MTVELRRLCMAHPEAGPNLFERRRNSSLKVYVWAQMQAERPPEANYVLLPRKDCLRQHLEKEINKFDGYVVTELAKMHYYEKKIKLSSYMQEIEHLQALWEKSRIDIEEDLNMLLAKGVNWINGWTKRIIKLHKTPNMDSMARIRALVLNISNANEQLKILESRDLRIKNLFNEEEVFSGFFLEDD